MVDGHIIEERRVVILTALPVEYLAVRGYLHDVREESHPQGTVYERGHFSANGLVWDVGLVEIGSGNTGAAFEVERAIGHFAPELILFIGIAEGLKDVKPGDVVAATKVYSYESGQAQRQFEPRPILWRSTYRMEQRARAEARKSDWLHRIKESTTSQAPRVFIAPIAAGEKVSISTRSETWKMLKAHYGDACAIETEGYGFLQAAHANQQVEALVIRGISSNIEEDQASHVTNAQTLAAYHASAFAFEILAKLEDKKTEPLAIDPRKVVPPRQLTGLPKSNDGSIVLYYSYADEDAGLLTQLQKQLIMLRRSDMITVWHRGMIRAGENENAERIRHLKSAHIILLLVSSHFLASERTYNEAALAMQLYKTKGVVVIPIINRPTADWQHTAFGGLWSLPRTEKAITEYSGAEREKLLKEVATNIRNIVEDLKAKQI